LNIRTGGSRWGTRLILERKRIGEQTSAAGATVLGQESNSRKRQEQAGQHTKRTQKPRKKTNNPRNNEKLKGEKLTGGVKKRLIRPNAVN